MSWLHRSRSLVAATSLVFLSALPVAADDWSRFRGPNGSGVSDSTDLPTEMGPKANVEWVASVPFGRSSPAVGRERIFLTAIEDGKLVTLAVDRASGKTAWRKELKPGHNAEFHKSTDSATSTPVTDGENVYAFFHEAGLVSYTGAGVERWAHPLGPFRNFYGIAASPVLAGGKLLMVCDQAEGSFLLALDAKTGAEVWHRKRTARVESYTTPILYPSAAEPRIALVFGASWVDAYDIATGADVWTLGGVGGGPVSSPILVGDYLYVVAKNHGEDGWADFSEVTEEHDKNKDGELDRAEVEGVWLANHFGWLDADANGKISSADWDLVGKNMLSENWGVYAIRIPKPDGTPEIAWNYRKNVADIASPLVYDSVFYMVHDGIITSLDAKTGKFLKRDRLGDGSPTTYSSPVAADGRIYIGTLEGELSILKAGPQWTVLHTSDLGDEIWATPAIADNHLYLRTRGNLYSFASKNATTKDAKPSTK